MVDYADFLHLFPISIVKRIRKVSYLKREILSFILTIS